MMPSDEFKNNLKKSPQPPDTILFFPHSIPAYTVLCVLLKMKQQLGLEAMLEYLDQYLEIINCHNPRLKVAVYKALSIVSVEKIYADAMGKGKRD